MTTFHDLRSRRRDLLNDLDELEDALAEVTAALDEPANDDEDARAEQRRHFAWLERQRAGLLVVLSETERALLEFGADGWDDP